MYNVFTSNVYVIKRPFEAEHLILVLINTKSFIFQNLKCLRLRGKLTLVKLMKSAGNGCALFALENQMEMKFLNRW